MSGGEWKPNHYSKVTSMKHQSVFQLVTQVAGFRHLCFRCRRGSVYEVVTSDVTLSSPGTGTFSLQQRDSPWRRERYERRENTKALGNDYVYTYLEFSKHDHTISKHNFSKPRAHAVNYLCYSPTLRIPHSLRNLLVLLLNPLLVGIWWRSDAIN